MPCEALTPPTPSLPTPPSRPHRERGELRKLLCGFFRLTSPPLPVWVGGRGRERRPGGEGPYAISCSFRSRRFQEKSDDRRTPEQRWQDPRFPRDRVREPRRLRRG